jgi:hypothetical protein
MATPFPVNANNRYPFIANNKMTDGKQHAHANTPWFGAMPYKELLDMLATCDTKEHVLAILADRDKSLLTTASWSHNTIWEYCILLGAKNPRVVFDALLETGFASESIRPMPIAPYAFVISEFYASYTREKIFGVDGVQEQKNYRALTEQTILVDGKLDLMRHSRRTGRRSGNTWSCTLALLDSLYAEKEKNAGTTSMLGPDKRDYYYVPEGLRYYTDCVDMEDTRNVAFESRKANPFDATFGVSADIHQRIRACEAALESLLRSAYVEVLAEQFLPTFLQASDRALGFLMRAYVADAFVAVEGAGVLANLSQTFFLSEKGDADAGDAAYSLVDALDVDTGANYTDAKQLHKAAYVAALLCDAVKRCLLGVAPAKFIEEADDATYAAVGPTLARVDAEIDKLLATLPPHTHVEADNDTLHHAIDYAAYVRDEIHAPWLAAASMRESGVRPDVAARDATGVRRSVPAPALRKMCQACGLHTATGVVEHAVCSRACAGSLQM